MRIQIIFAILIAVTACSAVFAHTAASPEMTVAAALMKQQRFGEAAALYELILAKDPKNAPAWYQLGTARYSLKDYGGSVKAFEANFQLSDNAFSLYNIACDYALLG
ncbi:MAG: tetratricopeptide repeat protein, partial [Acidobacteria bacterium]|nr:tetratricopeptide repeat protein [Acidobacteriota bacterium]